MGAKFSLRPAELLMIMAGVLGIRILLYKVLSGRSPRQTSILLLASVLYVVVSSSAMKYLHCSGLLKSLVEWVCIFNLNCYRNTNMKYTKQ